MEEKEEEGERRMEGRGGLSGNVAAEAFCLKSAPDQFDFIFFTDEKIFTVVPPWTRKTIDCITIPSWSWDVTSVPAIFVCEQPLCDNVGDGHWTWLHAAGFYPRDIIGYLSATYRHRHGFQVGGHKLRRKAPEIIFSVPPPQICVVPPIPGHSGACDSWKNWHCENNAS